VLKHSCFAGDLVFKTLTPPKSCAHIVLVFEVSHSYSKKFLPLFFSEFCFYGVRQQTEHMTLIVTLKQKMCGSSMSAAWEVYWIQGR